jgi:polyribonucleotide nucleotidyltransferase
LIRSNKIKGGEYMALTQKQEAFCQAVASGMSYKDAYIKAYDTKGKETTIYTESGKLAIREDIQERIKALQKPLEEANKIQGLNAREKQIKAIEDRIEKCIAKEDESSLIRYYDMLNKIYSLYKENDEQKENDNNLTSLNDDMLRKIVNR